MAISFIMLMIVKIAISVTIMTLLPRSWHTLHRCQEGLASRVGVARGALAKCCDDRKRAAFHILSFIVPAQKTTEMQMITWDESTTFACIRISHGGFEGTRM